MSYLQRGRSSLCSLIVLLRPGMTWAVSYWDNNIFLTWIPQLMSESWNQFSELRPVFLIQCNGTIQKPAHSKDCPMKHLVKFFTYWCTHDCYACGFFSVAGVEGKRGEEAGGRRWKRKVLKSTEWGAWEPGCKSYRTYSRPLKDASHQIMLSQKLLNSPQSGSRMVSLCNSWGLIDVITSGMLRLSRILKPA